MKIYIETILSGVHEYKSSTNQYLFIKVECTDDTIRYVAIDIESGDVYITGDVWFDEGIPLETQLAARWKYVRKADDQSPMIRVRGMGFDLSNKEWWVKQMQ